MGLCCNLDQLLGRMLQSGADRRPDNNLMERAPRLELKSQSPSDTLIVSAFDPSLEVGEVQL